MPPQSNLSRNVVIGSNGTAFAGPTSTPGPSNFATALDAGFLEMGFISEDGATFTEGRDITDINAWQSFFPLRRVVTARTVEVSFAMREFNKRSVELALGGTVTQNAAEWKYTPPAPDAIVTKSLVLEWEDGSKGYRLYIPVGLVTDSGESVMSRTAAVDLPITFSATDPGSGSIYTLFTNDISFSS